MNRASTIALAAVTIGQLSLVLPARAQTTMTFDANDCIGTPALVLNGPYVESGFELAFTTSLGLPGTYAFWCQFTSSYPGGPAIASNEGFGFVTLAAVGGGTFRLNSIDLASLFGGNVGGYAVGGSVLFTGNLLGGGTVQATGNFSAANGINPAFSTTLFGTDWTNLLSVTWRQSREYTMHQFDNIVLNGQDAEVVPEPATMSLLATGLAGMAAARRRRKQA